MRRSDSWLHGDSISRVGGNQSAARARFNTIIGARSIEERSERLWPKWLETGSWRLISGRSPFGGCGGVLITAELWGRWTESSKVPPRRRATFATDGNGG